MWLRHDKIESALRDTAAEFMAREAGPQSLITITRALVSEDGRRATILITVLPETMESTAVEFCNRNRGELGHYIEKRIRGIRVPHMEFDIDRGEKNRQRLDELTP